MSDFVTRDETSSDQAAQLDSFQKKVQQLAERVLSEKVQAKLGEAPAGAAGHAVFLSVCDGSRRAFVYNGVGRTLSAAWKSAVKAARKDVAKGKLAPLWIRADVVRKSGWYALQDVCETLSKTRSGGFRYGVAFDEGYNIALLDEELNGSAIFQYEKGAFSKKHLDRQLRWTGRPQLMRHPQTCILFRCRSWFCGEEGTVYALGSGKLGRGQKTCKRADASAVQELLFKSSGFLMRQAQEDGTFAYGYYPRFDRKIEGYNLLRHAGTIWALLCRYQMEPSEDLAALLHRAIQYLANQAVFQDAETAYLYEKESGELKLGACGIAIVAMVTYMEVFHNHDYRKLCCQLGNAILRQQNQETGAYTHVLNPDFTVKSDFRTVYYDGEATFALTRLYDMTGQLKWLEGASRAADHFLAEDYTQYKDHWISYAMNELTRQLPQRQDYLNFALRNAQRNLKVIYRQETAAHTSLELLMAAFETYLRAVDTGRNVENFALEFFLQTVCMRVHRQMEGFFGPETAMYMKNPARILNSFMIRQDQYRVRIDDVQHNIGGLYLYWKHYDRLVALGMPTDVKELPPVK